MVRCVFDGGSDYIILTVYRKKETGGGIGIAIGMFHCRSCLWIDTVSCRNTGKSRRNPETGSRRRPADRLEPEAALFGEFFIEFVDLFTNHPLRYERVLLFDALDHGLFGRSLDYVVVFRFAHDVFHTFSLLIGFAAGGCFRHIRRRTP